MTAPLPRPVEVINGWFVLRAVLKALVLFTLFNGVYVTIQPVQNGLLPTVYNGLVPGRIRFEQEYSANINQMLNDHVIRYATSDTYNILVVGSSETWGYRVQPTEAVPALIEGLNLQTHGGKPVHVYNLAFPIGEILKELIFTQAVYERGIPIDLVVVVVNFQAFSRTTPHVIVKSNLSYAQHVAELYHLPASYVPEAPPQSLWTDRAALRQWATDQALATKWSALSIDLVDEGLPPMSRLINLDSLPPSTRDAVLPAFFQFSQHTHIPMLLVVPPAPYERNAYSHWIPGQAQNAHLPLIDCSHVFTDPGAFQDKTHTLPSMYLPLARILARHLADPTIASLAPDLPLHLPASVPQDEGMCAYYQKSAVKPLPSGRGI